VGIPFPVRTIRTTVVVVGLVMLVAVWGGVGFLVWWTVRDLPDNPVPARDVQYAMWRFEGQTLRWQMFYEGPPEIAPVDGRVLVPVTIGKEHWNDPGGRSARLELWYPADHPALRTLWDEVRRAQSKVRVTVTGQVERLAKPHFNGEPRYGIRGLSLELGWK
jgi:hypothetical protein